MIRLFRILVHVNYLLPIISPITESILLIIHRHGVDFRNQSVSHWQNADYCIWSTSRKNWKFQSGIKADWITVSSWFQGNYKSYRVRTPFNNTRYSLCVPNLTYESYVRKADLRIVAKYYYNQFWAFMQRKYRILALAIASFAAMC